MYHLDCSNNYISSLVIPNEWKLLKKLDCSHNNLSSLVIPKELTNLKSLSCGYNPLSSLVIPNSYDIAEVTVLWKEECGDSED